MRIESRTSTRVALFELVIKLGLSLLHHVQTDAKVKSEQHYETANVGGEMLALPYFERDGGIGLA